jgi:predicted lipoprotein with Yx(FWY)xxD motif
VTWRGGEPLTKADGFSVRVRLPSQVGRVAFAAVQSCGETTVRWDQPLPADGSKPKHPAPAVTLAAAASTAQGRPLYIFNVDTMVGMSHCEGDCAKMWPPLLAPEGAKSLDGWSLIRRETATSSGRSRTSPSTPIRKTARAGRLAAWRRPTARARNSRGAADPAPTSHRVE